MEALLDVNSVARLLSLSPWTVRRLIADGKLLPVRLGRRVLIEPAEVERFVSQARRHGDGETDDASTTLDPRQQRSR